MAKENPQDRILNHLRKQHSTCTIHLTNGYQLKNAVVRAFDSFVIVIQSEDNKQMMLYKHAVSSITMTSPVPLDAPVEKA
ncbi:RNA chaperone Hfq [Christensenellaceae bacterium OttesenSCG-928-L17]|nr:RNA chaperone Hfq [Christensenellaceae bacterium OttesenSCG-928-L17]